MAIPSLPRDTRATAHPIQSSSPVPPVWISTLLLFIVFSTTGFLFTSCVPSAASSIVISTPAPLQQVNRPEIALDPVNGQAGTAVTVRGRGWPAQEMVIITFMDGRGRSDVLTSTTPDSNGAFETMFIYPASVRWLTPGLHTLVASTANQEWEATAEFAIASTAPLTAAPTATIASVIAAGGGGGDSAEQAETATWTPLPNLGPSIQIAPATGSANTRLTVTGREFPAGTRINVYLAGVVQASTTADEPHIYATSITDSSGHYATAFTMPATWPDGGPIETGTLAILVATEDFQVRATGTFDYVAPAATTTPTRTSTPTFTPIPTATPTRTPTLAANPHADAQPLSGGEGSRVTLTGGGFPANSQINVHLATFDGQVGSGPPVAYATTTTDARGLYRVDFVMPGRWPDGSPITPGRILLLVATANFSHEASAVFSYVGAAPTPTATVTPDTPYASVFPAEGGAGTQVTISGGAFPANTRVNLYLAGIIQASTVPEEPTIYATTVTDFRGNYSLSFAMPGRWPDGVTIETGRLALLIATADFALRTTGTFDFLATPATPPASAPWRGEYYNNIGLAGPPVVVRNDANIDFFWETGSPAPGLPADRFSVRWSNNLFLQGGTYRFSALADDGIRVWIDGSLVIDEWHDAQSATYTVEETLATGLHNFRVEYYENTLGARARFRWEQASTPAPTPTWTPVAQATLLFDGDPNSNRRNVNAFFCSGFESDCNFANCQPNFRLLWGPFCRERDYSYIQLGAYRVTLQGQGRVRAGATDYGETGTLYGFGQFDLNLPASYVFCWRGRQEGGYGFETVVQSLSSDAAIERITVEYLGEQCP